VGFVLDNIHIHSCTMDSVRPSQDDGLPLKNTKYSNNLLPMGHHRATIH
jgi:hypothetical protein